MSPIVIGGSGASGSNAGAEVDYAQITAGVNITANTVGTANTVVTGAAVAYDGSTAVIVEFFAPRVDMAPSTTPHLYLALFEDGTQIGVLADVTDNVATAYSWPVRMARRMTPTVGTHTYSIRGYHNTGAFTSVVQCGSGGAASGNLFPAFLRITRVA